MTNKIPVEWVPLDLPASDSGERPGSSVVTWEKIDLPNDAIQRDLAPSVKERLDRFPESFQKKAERAWEMIGKLETNPEIACEDPEIKTFIRQLAASGLIGGVHMREETSALWPDAPRAVDCLPTWLQKSFLQKKRLKSETSPLNRQQQGEVSARFETLMGDLPYKDRPHGRYFELSACARTSPQPRQYKYYVEGTKLDEVLQSGTLEKAVKILQHLGIGLECKLFEGERLVIYGKGDIAQADKFLDVLAAYGISGRGPAQDVWELTQETEGLLQERVAYSNDQALGDGGKLPERLDYPLKKYSPEAFTEWYLKVCAFTGKSPTEPYRTSFVYALGEKVDQVQPNIRAEAEALTGYPIVFAKRRME